MKKTAKKKLLIIPSWYPTPDDEINGSFFREQARLFLDDYDVKVLFISFSSLPAHKIRLIRGRLKPFINLYFRKRKQISLPDREIFTQPPLNYSVVEVFPVTYKSMTKIKVREYLRKLSELADGGWLPDIIHAHSAKDAGIVANHIKLKYGIPYVLTEHLPLNLMAYTEDVRQEIRDAFKNADRVLSLSYDKVRQLAMNEIDVEPGIIHNFVNEGIFNRIVPKYEPGTPLNIICIAAASYLKDHITLLRALQILHSRKIPFKLTLVGLKIWGKNETYDRIIHFIKANNLENVVSIVDRTARESIPGLLLDHNVFILSSIAEGMPVVVLEAMASGLVVIATRHGGTEDVMTPETGIMVNIKDYESIAVNLEDIYLGRKQFEPAEIRKTVVALCGVDAFKQRLGNYYNEITAKYSG